jgi:hypothetical protein
MAAVLQFTLGMQEDKDMMTPGDALDMERELVRRGLPAAYAALLGDCIEVDENGKWVVRNLDGEVIDRIEPLPTSD